MDTNEVLKDKFQKLHTELIGQNLWRVVDRLFAAQVIGAENVEDLNLCAGSAGWSSAKSRLLMTLLHRSGHPRAFTELRDALCAEDSLKWIVDRLDELPVNDKLAHKATNSAQCQCPNCGHPHQSAAATMTGKSR